MAAPKSIDWDLQPLGEMNDCILAERLGVTSAAVFFARRKRDIPACQNRRRPPEHFDWDRWPLGLVDDSVLARNIGCDHSTVSLARKRRGVPAFRRVRPRLKDDLSAVLGTKTDREIAEDEQAKGLDVTAGIAERRRKAGIPGTRINWTAVEGLGSAPDAAIAERYGVTHTVVAGARWRQGIERWREERRCPCGEMFTAWRSDQRFCGRFCASSWWWMVASLKISPSVADLTLALRAYKRTLARKEPINVEK